MMDRKNWNKKQLWKNWNNVEPQPRMEKIEGKMETLQKALKHVLRPLFYCSEVGFRAESSEGEKHV